MDDEEAKHILTTIRGMVVNAYPLKNENDRSSTSATSKPLA